MPKVPKRPLEFNRYAKSAKAKKLLKEIALQRWGKIFGWQQVTTQQKKKPNSK